jgi:hypothetical protein
MCVHRGRLSSARDGFFIVKNDKLEKMVRWCSFYENFKTDLFFFVVNLK